MIKCVSFNSYRTRLLIVIFFTTQTSQTHPHFEKNTEFFEILLQPEVDSRTSPLHTEEFQFDWSKKVKKFYFEFIVFSSEMGRKITLATCSLNQWAMDFEGNLRRILLSE